MCSDYLFPWFLISSAGWFKGEKKKIKNKKPDSLAQRTSEQICSAGGGCLPRWRWGSGGANLCLSDANWISHLGNAHTPPATYTLAKASFSSKFTAHWKHPSSSFASPFAFPSPVVRRLEADVPPASTQGLCLPLQKHPRSAPAPREISPAERRALLSSKRRNSRPAMTEVW